MDHYIKRTLNVNGCWEWQGCLNTDGYPRVRINGNSNIKLHRHVYEQTKGRIPDKYVIRHKCDNPKCINPDHLLSGTPSDNTYDRYSRKRTSKAVSSEKLDLIKKLRAEGVSQTKVAKLVGCSQSHISKMELGKYVFVH